MMVNKVCKMVTMTGAWPLVAHDCPVCSSTGRSVQQVHKYAMQFVSINLIDYDLIYIIDEHLKYLHELVICIF